MEFLFYPKTSPSPTPTFKTTPTVFHCNSILYFCEMRIWCMSRSIETFLSQIEPLLSFSLLLSLPIHRVSPSLFKHFLIFSDLIQNPSSYHFHFKILPVDIFFWAASCAVKVLLEMRTCLCTKRVSDTHRNGEVFCSLFPPCLSILPYCVMKNFLRMIFIIVITQFKVTIATSPSRVNELSERKLRVRSQTSRHVFIQLCRVY